jgi:hypothetical protein
VGGISYPIGLMHIFGPMTPFVECMGHFFLDLLIIEEINTFNFGRYFSIIEKILGENYLTLFC